MTERQKSRLDRTVSIALADPALGLGAVVGLALVLLSALGPFLWTSDPLGMDFNALLAPPSLDHPFGTDANGRDVLARVLAGGRISLAVGTGVALFGLLVGGGLGLVAGLSRGLVDQIVGRGMDALAAFPPLILAMAITVGFGGGLVTASLGVLVSTLPFYVRLIRADVLRLRNEPFVETTIGLGASPARVVAVHILPHTASTVLIQSAGVFGYSIGRAEARRIAERLLAEVEIRNPAERLGSYPWQFSGGMLQRVVIAIALANAPELLIADEPTTALDGATSDQILGLLDAVSRARGLAVMLITHNLGLVARFASDVLVLYDGQAMETGAVAEVFAQPLHPYTAALLATVPRADWPREKPMPTIPGAPPAAGEDRRGCSFAPRCALSKGRGRCVADTPVLRPVQGADPTRRAACHFAEEMIGVGVSP